MMFQVRIHGRGGQGVVTAAELLKTPDSARRNGRGGTALTSAGAPWTEEEDARACAEYDGGMTIAQLNGTARPSACPLPRPGMRLGGSAGRRPGAGA